MSPSEKLTIVIVLNGTIASESGFRALINRASRVYAADGGANHCYRHGIIPLSFFGDRDSVEPAVYRWLSEQDVELHAFPSRKDETDSELILRDLIAALRAERQAGCSWKQAEIILAAAFGERQDHVLANQLLAATLVEPAIIISLSDGLIYQRIVRGPNAFSLDWPPPELETSNGPDWAFSALSLSGEVSGINYDGADYPLRDARLQFGMPRGVSNQLNQTGAMSDGGIGHLRDVRISLAEGCLTVMVLPAV